MDANSGQVYNEFVEHLQKIADFSHASAILHWDKEIYLLEDASSTRSRQIATLETTAHELFINCSH